MFVYAKLSYRDRQYLNGTEIHLNVQFLSPHCCFITCLLIVDLQHLLHCYKHVQLFHM